MAVDPTAIPIELDPHEQRMRGIAREGNVPFDVPYISHISGRLFQGGCDNRLILPPHIDHLVSLYPWGSYQVKHELATSLTVRMYDSHDGADIDQVIAIARWVNACLLTGDVLVHCQAGLNRSSLVCATAIVLQGNSPELAIQMIRSARSEAALCNKAFEAMVHVVPGRVRHAA